LIRVTGPAQRQNISCPSIRVAFLQSSLSETWLFALQRRESFHAQEETSPRPAAPEGIQGSGIRPFASLSRLLFNVVCLEQALPPAGVSFIRIWSLLRVNFRDASAARGNQLCEKVGLPLKEHRVEMRELPYPTAAASNIQATRSKKDHKRRTHWPENNCTPLDRKTRPIQSRNKSEVV